MYNNLKNAIDKVLATIAIILLLPFYFAISILVKLTSPGPVFFKQSRIGKDGKEFWFYKYRTMYTVTDADKERRFVKKLMTGEYGKVGEQTLLKLYQDPRITPIGRFLRKTYLDELPLYFNVIKGDMSIIGPRPTIPYEYQQLKKLSSTRFKVKPGITGLWQISRNKSSLKEMIELDSYYAGNVSLLLDLSIILKTMLHGLALPFRRKG